MDADYEDPLAGPEPSAAPAPWDDPTIGAYLERAQQADRDRIDRELARIDDQLADRDTLHNDLVTDLEWRIDTYERELDRVTTPFAPKPEARARIARRLRDLRQQLRAERRQHWQDRQQLLRERRDLLRDRAALTDDTLSELLY